MADSNDVDVFVSYAHDDRDRVRPLVEKLKAARLSVWWDREIQIGGKWRNVISDRLAHAKSVCVFWSIKSRIELGRYAPFASGRMVEEIERQRGHCKRITQIYIESGGLRESLPATVSSEAKDALDDLVLSMAGADADLFQQMTAVGSALSKEGAIITNFLLSEQPKCAVAHLRERASKLFPLQQELAQGMGRVDRLIVDLGIDL